MRIRAHKRLGMWVWGSEQTRSGAHKWVELWKLKTKFFISLGVQKTVDGNLAELYILRDSAAKVYTLSPMRSESSDGNSMWDMAIDLSRPEILHGKGPNLDAKHFKRI